MAIRNDISVRFDLSPRLAEVAPGSNELTVQDAHDTLTTIQDSVEGSEFPDMISTAGGEALGGGVTVGLTTTLDNTQVAPGATSPRSVGTVTTLDSTGVSLIDSGATFQTDGVVRGDWVINFTDQSVTEVLVVVSETELTTRGLRDGTANTFAVNDAYKVWAVSEFDLSGGNFVAVDDVDASIAPIFTSFGRFAVKTSSSSATLQELEDIQFASYDGRISIDTTSPYSGTAFPAGTRRAPVNNLADAILISLDTGIKTLFSVGNLTFGPTVSLDSYTIRGNGAFRSLLTFDTDAVLNGCVIVDATIQGLVDNDCIVRDCVVDGCDIHNGVIYNSALRGNIAVTSTSSGVDFFGCYSAVAGTSTPVLNMQGSTCDLSVRGYSGGITIENKSSANPASLDIHSGQIILDSTVTNGTIVCRGTGKLIDNSVGATVLNEVLSGLRQILMEKVLRNRLETNPSTGVMTIYDDDGVTPLITGSIFEDVAGTQPYQGQGVDRRNRLQ